MSLYHLTNSRASQLMLMGLMCRTCEGLSIYSLQTRAETSLLGEKKKTGCQNDIDIVM